MLSYSEYKEYSQNLSNVYRPQKLCDVNMLNDLI